jgi:hypothetical protein
VPGVVELDIEMMQVSDVVGSELVLGRGRPWWQAGTRRA